MPMTITHAKSNTIANFTGTVTVGNSSGGTQTVAATDLVRPGDWNSAHQTTLSLTGSEVASLFNFGRGLTSSSDGSGLSVGIRNVPVFEPWPLLNTNSTMVAFPAGTWYFDPVCIPFGLNSGHLRFLYTYNSANFSHGVNLTTTSGYASKSARFRNVFALYNQGTGANSTRLESIWSGACEISATQILTVTNNAGTAITYTASITYGFISQIDISGNTTSGTTGTSGTGSVGATSANSTTVNSLLTGVGLADYISGSLMGIVPFATSIPAGLYWIAHMHTIDSLSSSTSGGANYLAGTCFNSSPGLMCILDPVLTAFKRLGSSSAGSSITGVVPFKGQYATTSSAPFAFANTSDMRASTGRLYWQHCQFSSN